MSPSADTKREDQMRGMEMLFQNNPALAAGLAPEYIGIQDWKNAQGMADIAKKIRGTQFPGVDFGDDKDKQQQIPPQVQQALQQAQMQAQAMQQELQKIKPEMDRAHQAEASTKIENMSIKAQKDLEAEKLRIEKFNADTQRMIAEAQIGKIQGEMLLKEDDQQHAQLMDKAKIVHDTNLDRHTMNQDAQNQAHTHAKDVATLAMASEGADHQRTMDESRLDLDSQKMAQAEAAAKAGPTGGKPGKSASPGR